MTDDDMVVRELLLICGSLRAASTNMAMMRTVLQMLPDGVAGTLVVAALVTDAAWAARSGRRSRREATKPTTAPTTRTTALITGSTGAGGRGGGTGER